MSATVSLDDRTSHDLVVAAYRAGKINGVQAWDTLSQRNLWPEREEAFYHYSAGLESFETQKELWRAPGRFKHAARSLVTAAHANNVVSAASVEWLQNLFGYPKGDLPCGE